MWEVIITVVNRRARTPALWKMVAHSCQLPKFWTHIRHWFGATTTQGNVSTMDVVSGAITHSCSITVRLAAHVNHIWWDHKRWIRWEIFQMNWFDFKWSIFSVARATFTKVLLLQAGEMKKGQEKHLNNRSDSEKEEGGWARGEGGVAPVGLSLADYPAMSFIFVRLFNK